MAGVFEFLDLGARFVGDLPMPRSNFALCASNLLALASVIDSYKRGAEDGEFYIFCLLIKC